MGNLINQCLYLLACCCLLTVSPAVSTPVTALKITLHHALSSLLVRGTPTEAQVSANGGAGAEDAEFYRSLTVNGNQELLYTYQSVKYPGNYLMVDSQGSFSLGTEEQQFKNEVLGTNLIGVYADVTGQTNPCYLAFDANGNQVSNPCASDIDKEKAKLTVLSS